MMWGTASRRLGASQCFSVASFYAFINNNSNFNSRSDNRNNTNCECNNKERREKAKLLRKMTTLQYANAAPTTTPSSVSSPHSAAPSTGTTTTTTILRRTNTREELSKLRRIESEMLRRWQKDEDGWRELPARAWPAFQPNAEQLEGIREQIKMYGCNKRSVKSKSTSTTNNDQTDMCSELLFNAATSLVFYQIDPQAGLQQYEKLAKQGHVDSMVACGVVLLEGMGGIQPNEVEGIEWLKKAVEFGSPQACYELGTALYTGIDDVVEEDPEGAFELFERAAKSSHTAALYMMADCLVEGEGTQKDIARAVPLFYKAAEQGHRYSRQRIRELLARKEYQIPL